MNLVIGTQKKNEKKNKKEASRQIGWSNLNRSVVFFFLDICTVFLLTWLGFFSWFLPRPAKGAAGGEK